MPGVLVAVGVTPSTAPSTGVCSPWALEADVCGPCTEETADLGTWLQVASDLLFELSGQRFPGICSDTVRPCIQSCHGSSPRYYGDLLSSSPYQWYGACGCNRTPCGCSDLSELWLTGWPLVSIEEILVDGAILDPSLYRIDDWKKLVRVDGEAWPSCQDMALATTEADTFQIEFTYGGAIPAAGAAAAATLGCQLALSCAGSSECRLPQRVQSVTRQGVSFVMLDPFQFLENGMTGLYEVDLFLNAYGVGSKARWPALTVNPDRHSRTRRVTG